MSNLIRNKEQKQKNDDIDGEALHKLIKNAVYGKNTLNLKHKTNVRFVSSKNNLFKMDIKIKLHVTENL